VTSSWYALNRAEGLEGATFVVTAVGNMIVLEQHSADIDEVQIVWETSFHKSKRRPLGRFVLIAKQPLLLATI